MYASDDDVTVKRWQQQPSGATVHAAAESFRMLSDPTRLAMLWRLCGGEYDVTTLARAVGVARPAVSQHLAKLRLTGLVATRRDGRRVVYHARGGHLRPLPAQAGSAAEHRLTGAPEHD